jgi:hypothetical protein
MKAEVSKLVESMGGTHVYAHLGPEDAAQVAGYEHRHSS